MPLTRLTLEERIRLVRFFSIYEKSSTIQTVWRRQFGTDPPSRKTIAALNKKFDETGSVADLTRTGRPKTSRTEEKIALVQNAIRSDPTKSIRILSNELGLNKASVHRIKQDADRNGYLKLENKRLKEKINELQRRVDILEGRKPSAKNAKKANSNLISMPNFTSDDIKPIPYMLSRTSGDQDSEESKYELLHVDDEHGQTLSVEHNTRSTVITVLATSDNDQHSFEINDGHAVHHLTIDANGHLQEIDQDDVEQDEEEIAPDHMEAMTGEILEEEEIDMLPNHELITRQHSEKMETGEVIISEVLLFDQEQEHITYKENSHTVEQAEELIVGQSPVEVVVEELVDCPMELPISFITATK